MGSVSGTWICSVPESNLPWSVRATGDGRLTSLHCRRVRTENIIVGTGRMLMVKPLAAGRLLPAVGLAFVWNTIRDQDMVAIGITTPDEAKEVIDLSLDFLNRRLPDNELQATRSKESLTAQSR